MLFIIIFIYLIIIKILCISSDNGTMGLVIDATIVTYVVYDIANASSVLQQVKDVFNASRSQIEKYAPLHYSTSLKLDEIAIHLGSDPNTTISNKKNI